MISDASRFFTLIFEASNVPVDIAEASRLVTLIFEASNVPTLS